jgi:hypothetical protein
LQHQLRLTNGEENLDERTFTARFLPFGFAVATWATLDPQVAFFLDK